MVKDGLISMLEGYSYDEEPWPDDTTDFELEYIDNRANDMRVLAEATATRTS